MSKFVRLSDIEDPRRCKSSGQRGSCPFQAVPLVPEPNPDFIKSEWSDYCPRHGANRQIAQKQTQSKDLYLVAMYQERIKNGKDHPDLKTLHTEISILRMLLETKLNQINDDFDLITQASGISALVSNIERTVVSAHKLDERLGSLLSKEDALVIVRKLLEIITNYIEDPEVLEFLSEDMVDCVKSFSRENQI